jgi:phosphatidylglycerophosphatase GEP4
LGSVWRPRDDKETTRKAATTTPQPRPCRSQRRPFLAPSPQPNQNTNRTKKQREPSLAVPHISVPDIRWIDWRALRAAGFEAVVFDKDNTLTAPFAVGGGTEGGGKGGGNAAHPRVRAALADARRVFGDGRLALFSNSAGLAQYDPHGHEAEAVERGLGVRVLRHDKKKPAGGRDDLERALAALAAAPAAAAAAGGGGAAGGKKQQPAPSFDATRAVFVGDRALTDVAYGNRHGMLTVRVAPLVTGGGVEPPTVALARALEGALAARWRRLGVKAPGHALLERVAGGAAGLVRRPAAGEGEE